MISLYRYIFEAIERNELEKDLKFVKMTDKEFESIIMSDEYDNGKALLGEFPDEKISDLVLLYNQSTKFKIDFKGDTLGIVVYALPKDIVEKLQYSHPMDEEVYKNICLKPFINVHYNNEVKSGEEVFDKPKSNESEEEYFDKIFRETAYITAWQLSKDAKKKTDVNEISLVKVFFEKLIKELKDAGVKYIWAHAKNERITKLYVKLANFINPINTFKDIFKKHKTRRFHKDEFFVVENIVIKKI